MEINYPITVYYVDFDRVREEIFDTPPKHYLDCHSIKGDFFILSTYDINTKYHLCRKNAVAELKNDLTREIKYHTDRLNKLTKAIKELNE